PVGSSGPFTQGLMLAGMYLFSTVIALVAAAVLGRTVLKGPRVPLLLEMPPYRVPHWPSVLHMMWEKSSVFLKEAGSVILLCSPGMWALPSSPRPAAVDGAPPPVRAQQIAAAPEPAAASAAAERMQNSLGGQLGRGIEPAIAPLGFDWKIGIGLIGAFAA